MKLGPIKSILGKKTFIWGAGLALVLGGSPGMRSLVGSVHHSSGLKTTSVHSETVDPSVTESPDPAESPEPTESPEPKETPKPQATHPPDANDNNQAER